MESSARINLKLSDGTYQSIYIHWGGYPENIAPLLLNYYNTPDKIKKLMSFGDADTIGKTTEASELIKKYGFNYINNESFINLNQKEKDRLRQKNLKENTSVFYRRDNNESIKDTKSITTNQPKEESHTYVFKEFKWYLYDSKKTPNYTLLKQSKK